MANKEKYSQCHLERRTDHSVISTTSYIPQKFAKKGHVVDLRNDDKTWSRGWVVISVGDVTDSLPDWRQSIKGHRAMTGDNLPKMCGVCPT